MAWLLYSLVGYLGYRFAVREGWMQPIPLLGGGPQTVVIADIETYMPQNLQTVVLSVLGNSTNPAQLISLAQTYNTYYPSAAYSLMHRAWQLAGGASSGQPEPQPPTPAQMTAAQVAWAASQVVPSVPVPAPAPAPSTPTA